MSEMGGYSTKNGVVERREFPRIEVNTQVNFVVVVPGSETASTKDISQAGMCLDTTRKLSEGMILRLTFDLPGEPPEHIEALGRVIWQRPKTDSTYATGIKFLT